MSAAPEIAAFTIKPLRLRLKNRFITARGSKTESNNLCVRICLSSGETGSGEACSSLAWPENSPAAMKRCLEQIGRRVSGKTVAQAFAVIQASWGKPWARPAALAAVECATIEAQALHEKTLLWKYLARMAGAQARKPAALKTSLTLSPAQLTTLRHSACLAHRRGFTTLKVKVIGKDPQEDLMRLTVIHQTAPKMQLIADANQAFTPQQAFAFARAMKLLRLPVILFEQPVAWQDLDGMAWLTRHAGIPTVADESMRSVDDARRIIRKRAADVLNIKISKCGLLGALEIVKLARKKKMALMIGCMSESAQGLAPSIALARGTGAFRYIDLDSHLLIKGSICNPRI